MSDYEKSIIGTFTTDLLATIEQTPYFKDNLELYFTITKFDNDYGYSLIHQETEEGSEIGNLDDLNQSVNPNPDIRSAVNPTPNPPLQDNSGYMSNPNDEEGNVEHTE